MKAALLAILWSFLSITGVHAADTALDLFTKKEFNAATLVQAANHYIGLGEARAVEALMALDGYDPAAMDRGIRMNERIGWVCRIVFQGDEGKPLREPMYGGLSLPYLTMPLERWPLYPVAESDGVFFVLSEGYDLEGVAESARGYIDYCRTTGKFRKSMVPVPTQGEAIKAFDTLKGSDRWKKIKWKDEELGTKYTMHEDTALREIEAQATSIPKK